jgi:hypothetical protein
MNYRYWITIKNICDSDSLNFQKLDLDYDISNGYAIPSLHIQQ